MQTDTREIDIISLISEKNSQLRKLCENQWNAGQHVKITSTEWYVLSQLYNAEPSVSQVAKSVNITRQATHKCLRSLQEKGLLKIVIRPHNKRNRFIVLTPYGNQCWAEYSTIKKQLEEQIALTIGADNVNLIKEHFSKDWRC